MRISSRTRKIISTFLGFFISLLLFIAPLPSPKNNPNFWNDIAIIYGCALFGLFFIWLFAWLIKKIFKKRPIISRVVFWTATSLMISLAIYVGWIQIVNTTLLSESGPYEICGLCPYASGDWVYYMRPAGTGAFGQIAGIPGDYLEFEGGRILINGKESSDQFQIYYDINLRDRFMLDKDEYYVLPEKRAGWFAYPNELETNIGVVQKEFIRGKVVNRIIDPAVFKPDFDEGISICKESGQPEAYCVCVSNYVSKKYETGQLILFGQSEAKRAEIAIDADNHCVNERY